MCLSVSDVEAQGVVGDVTVDEDVFGPVARKCRPGKRSRM